MHSDTGRKNVTNSLCLFLDYKQHDHVPETIIPLFQEGLFSENGSTL